MKLESNTLRPELEDAPAKLLLLESSRYNSLRLHVQSSRFSDRRSSVCRSLGKKCRGGGNLSRGPRFCRGGCFSLAEVESELSALLLGPSPVVTVGLAFERAMFGRIRVANGTPRTCGGAGGSGRCGRVRASFPENVLLERADNARAGRSGAIARYLAKFGEGVQQVEFRCTNVDRATEILKDKFDSSPSIR